MAPHLRAVAIIIALLTAWVGLAPFAAGSGDAVPDAAAWDNRDTAP